MDKNTKLKKEFTPSQYTGSQDYKNRIRKYFQIN